ncbi:MAG: response regulator [Synergistaceae bacterium]|jgi:signal transduction histidine kinase/CheY-like chemotaxis protein/HPt (histidine-containing phosphotransfer) domain-containing protein|nr:response regulator [Synergistaceae bacterium]
MASLFPLVLSFSVMLLTTGRVILSTNTAFTRETALFFARQTEARIENQVVVLSNTLSMAAHSVENTDMAAPDAKSRIDGELQRLFDVDKNLDYAWVAIGFGVFPDKGRYMKTWVRSGDVPVEMLDTDDNPLRSPWFNIPQVTGRFWFEPAEPYSTGEAMPRYREMISRFLWKDGKIIGSLGLSMTHGRVFRFIDGQQVPDERKLLLLSEEGNVVYSTDNEYQGLSLSDFALPEEGRIQRAMAEKMIFLEEGTSPVFGKTSLICVYPIRYSNAGRGLFLYLDMSMEALQRTAWDTVRVVATTSLLGLFLMTVSIFLAVRNIVRPIRGITNSASRLAGGELDVAFDTIDDDGGSTRNEVTILHRALKKMLDQLYQIQELKVKAVRADYEKEQSEAALREKIQFFANISHEIRTPMNAILGMSELLLEEKLEERPRRYVRDIHVSAGSLLEIINDVLDFSKMETDKITLMPSDFDFHMMLDNVRALISMVAREKNLVFEGRIKGEIPQWLHGDALRLRQVFLNLLGNAVKYTKEGYVRLDVSYENQLLIFTVTDSGIGIREEDLPLIFEAFRQLPHSRGLQVQGTGLGLSITRKLVDLMGGTMSVSSTYGSGSVFSVQLPMTVGDEKASGRDAERLEGFLAPSARVLVVDDNTINLNVTEGMLRLFGITPDRAMSAPEALEIICGRDHEKPGYDIVFMDHMMPGMDGVEATQKIRAMGGEYEHLIIVALTANAMVGTKEMLLKKGMNDFLSKPISRRELALVLHRWLPAEKIGKGAAEPTSPAAVEAAKFLERLSTVSELNVSVGQERAAGSVELYRKILQQMRDMIPDFCAETDRLRRQEDQQALRIKMHSIKASLATTGALELAGYAREFELAAATGNMTFCRDNLPAFSERLLAFAGELGRTLLEADGTTRRKTGDDGLLYMKLRDLYGAVTENDYGAIIDTLQELLRHSFGEENDRMLTNLEALIDQFDYDAVLENIRSVWPNAIPHFKP